MKFKYKPKVYLVAKSIVNVGGLSQFLHDEELSWPTESLTPIVSSQYEQDSFPRPSEQLTELAGRCCYMSFGKKAGSKTNEAYVDNLLGRTADGGFRPGPAHGSVLEHATFSFIVTGAGRGFSHEQVRHRAGWAYSQLSTRYCDFEREEKEEGTWEPGFTIPPMGQLSEETKALIESTHNNTLESYKLTLSNIERDLLANEEFMSGLAHMPVKERDRALRKAARGAARDVLPNGTEAIMVMTANARAIWNTIALRASEHAEAEIRDIYVQITRIMENEMPNVFKGIKYIKLWDGSEAVELPRDKI